METDIIDRLTHSPNSIEINLRSKKAPKSFGANYINCHQRTDVWHEIRKNRVTGSRLPALLGFYGSGKYNECLGVVLNQAPERDLSAIKNIQRGIMYEDEGIEYFERVSGSSTEKVGFFIHPRNVRFGASPDAVCASGLLLEVKTRAAGTAGPLESLDPFPNYFLQCQLQMACANAHACLLLSYHPETQKGNFFLVTKDAYLMGVVMEVVNAMIDNKTLTEWHHLEPKKLSKVGDQLLHKKIGFDNLKLFRSYIKSFCKHIPSVKFQ